MKKPALLILCLIFFLSLTAQDMKYSRVQIMTGPEGIQKLLESGVPVDDGIVRPGAYITCEISEADLARVAALGYQYEVLIDDVSRYYAERSGKEMGILGQLLETDHPLNREWPVPEGFSLGSVGGFCSIQEMLDHLDNMLANYPNLISPVYQLDSLTHEGRPVYWVRISDNPTQNEEEPEVLYTGMHHAREPIGMQHLLFFMYHLLENYDTDPEVQALVNNTELYFVPILNPDGYARNIFTNPNGGGSWRKNRRVNGDGTYGVDLNRNYGYAWGYSNSGSSPDPGDDTYRGPEAFSEPCTRNMKDFCEEHEFRIALNYHSYANLLLYPWGYIPDFPPDYDIFHSFGEIMSAEHGYTYGPGYTTIYVTNGSSDDWMYGEQETKEKIFAYTPEVGGGSDGFWPSPSRIIPLCQENMWQSMMAAKLTGPYAEVSDLSPSIVPTMEGYFNYSLKRMGLDENATYTVSITPVNDAIASVCAPVAYEGLELFESIDDSLSFALKENILSGEEIIFLLSVDNGYYITSDTITKVYGTPVVVFEDDGNAFQNWTSNMWGNTTLSFVSPDKSIADSPYGNYNNYEVNPMVLDEAVDLTDAAYAVLGFWAKWEIEAGYDYVQIQVSANGQNWTSLEGKYTRPGTENQAPGQPVYDGFQSNWVREEIDLSDWLGQQVYLRFILRADSYVVEDGFYWDDLNITVIDLATEVKEPGAADPVTVLGPFPNPAGQQVSFRIDPSDGRQQMEIAVYDISGREIIRQGIPGSNEVTLDVAGWPEGLYHYRITADGRTGASGKLIVQ